MPSPRLLTPSELERLAGLADAATLFQKNRITTMDLRSIDPILTELDWTWGKASEGVATYSKSFSEFANRRISFFGAQVDLDLAILLLREPASEHPRSKSPAAILGATIMRHAPPMLSERIWGIKISTGELIFRRGLPVGPTQMLLNELPALLARHLARDIDRATPPAQAPAKPTPRV